MMPGTQVKGAKSNGGSQPPRNRIVVSAHISTMATYSPSMNSRYGVERIFDHVAGDEFRFGFRQVEGRPVRLGQRRDEEDDEHREQRQPVPVEEACWAGRACVPSPSRCDSTMSVRLSEPTQSSTVTMTKPIETS